MPQEIERKFLVTNDAWRDQAADSCVIKQGYLSEDPSKAVRVRLSADKAWLTIKGLGDQISRPEFEYPIPVADAEFMLANMCDQGLIEKQRFFVPHQGHTWEVDVFAGTNKGLVLAEIELESIDEHFAMPDWIGAEVSDDSRYFNLRLMRHPYTSW